MDKSDFELTDAVRESVNKASAYFAEAAANPSQFPQLNGIRSDHRELSEQLLAKMNAHVEAAAATWAWAAAAVASLDYVESESAKRIDAIDNQVVNLKNSPNFLTSKYPTSSVSDKLSLSDGSATVFCYYLATGEYHCEWMFDDGLIIEYPSATDDSGGWGDW